MGGWFTGRHHRWCVPCILHGERGCTCTSSTMSMFPYFSFSVASFGYSRMDQRVSNHHPAPWNQDTTPRNDDIPSVYCFVISLQFVPHTFLHTMSRTPLWIELMNNQDGDDTEEIRPRRVVNKTPGRVPADVWAAAVLYFCDLPQLIRLCWTCSTLREIIQRVDFVVDWQENSYYCVRQCRCKRHQFYLDVGAWCPFTWELYAPMVVDTTEDLEDMLMSQKRSLRHAAARYQRTLGVQTPLPYLDPQRSFRSTGRAQLFTPGGYHASLERNIVPLPRMVEVAVEDANVMPILDTYVDDDPTLTIDAKRARKFWRTYHAVTPEDVQIDKQLASDPSLWRRYIKAADFDHRLQAYNHGYDPVRNYLYKAKAMRESDLFHPAHPQLQMDLLAAARWARIRMTKTAVGQPTTPMDLCLREDQMPARGANDMTQLYLNADGTGSPAYEPSLTPVRHRGVVYIDRVRYTYELGDFVPWALSMEAVLHAYYFHAWYDSSSDLLHRIIQYTWLLGQQVEQDMRQEMFTTRWTWLCHVEECENCYAFLHGRVHDSHLGSKEDDRDLQAIDMMKNQRYHSFRVTLNRSAMFGHVHQVPYMSYLLGQFLPDEMQHTRSAMQIMVDLTWCLRCANFVLDFATSVGPLVDPVTQMERRLEFTTLLRMTASMLLFAPVFRPRAPLQPSDTRRTAPFYIPLPLPNWNHRFTKYERFIRRIAQDPLPGQHPPAYHNPFVQLQREAQQAAGAGEQQATEYVHRQCKRNRSE